MKEVTADVVKMARELEIKTEDEAQLLASHDQLLTNADLHLIAEQVRLFLK